MATSLHKSLKRIINFVNVYVRGNSASDFIFKERQTSNRF